MSRALKLTLAAVVAFLVILLVGGLLLTRIISNTIPPGKAGEIIAREHPGAIVTEIDKEYNGNKLLYEVEYVLNNKNYSAVLDGESGEILSDSAQADTSSPVKEELTVQKATQKAIADAGFSPGEVTLKEASLENHEGKVAYVIEFIYSGTKYEYIINAETGTIESITTKALD